MLSQWLDKDVAIADHIHLATSADQVPKPSAGQDHAEADFTCTHDSPVFLPGTFTFVITTIKKQP